MVFDLIRALLAAVAAGVIPGYFWSKLLSPSADGAERITYSVALSMALVPAVALATVRALGTSVTLPVAAASALVVLATGVAAYRAFGPAKGSGSTLGAPPVSPGALALAPVALAFALVLGSTLVNLDLFRLAGSCDGWPSEDCIKSGGAQELILPTALLLAVAGAVYLLSSRRASAPHPQPLNPERDQSGRRSWGLGRRLLLPVVLALVLVRGYLGPILYDWPLIRGLDHYSHTVMANQMMFEGEIRPYLIYPPGFHTTTAVISRFSGLDPLDVFPVLGPALLLLPTLALYALARRLWGWAYGVAAAFLGGVIMGGLYYYFNDSMYPNLTAAQFFLVLTVAALIGMYRSPSVRNGLLLAVLGSAVILYHQVSSLYLAVLLLVVSVAFLPYLLLKRRREGLALFGSLALMVALSVFYVWDTYQVPQAVAGLVGGSESSTTGNAIAMALGTQEHYGLGSLIVAIVSQPVAWLGLLGAIFLLADQRGWTSAPEVLTRITLLAWVLVLLAGASTTYSGFPQRFGRDLGAPLALLASLALVLILGTLFRRRRAVLTFVASLAVVLIVTLTGLRTAQSFKQATGPSSHLTTTLEISAAGEWLEEHNTGGNIMVSPHANQVPSRMMLAMGDYSSFQSFSPWQIKYARDLPPRGPEPLQDVLWVMNHPGGERTEEILRERDIRYIVLYKDMPDRPVAEYWKLFESRPDLYRTVFENEDVLIVTRKEQ